MKTLKNKCEESQSHKIRERVFSIVYKNSNFLDLASYISDDFGLICDALQIDYNNTWLNALWIKYSKMEIHSGDIGKIEGKLTNLLDRV